MSEDQINPDWSGHLELKNAKWELDSGRTVEFRIVYYGTEPIEHPFRNYQRQRGGKVGQRFHAIIVDDGTTMHVYDGEAMLAGWSDNEGGRTVKFWLDEEAERHPFAGFSKRTTKDPGSMFSAALKVLQDDNTAQPEPVKKSRPLSSDVHMMITGQLFIQYLRERSSYTAILTKQGKDWTPDIAKSWVKKQLKIESLSELDMDDRKAARFHTEIREPFVKWQGKE